MHAVRLPGNYEHALHTNPGDLEQVGHYYTHI